MTKLLGGTAHTLPADFETALQSSKLGTTWNGLTPLGRNEFICWVTSGTKAETQVKRINVALDKLGKGERRPCCWAGCIHRTDKAPNNTQKWLFEKQLKRPI